MKHKYIHRNYTHLFIKLVEWNQFDEATYLFDLYPKKLGTDINIKKAFRHACLCGHLQLAQWLYQIKPTMDISAYDEHPLRFTL
jgi:hypothetical protein